MKIKFSKMHGNGNDFVVIDGVNQNIDLSKQTIKKLADRNYGVGFDQLLIVKSLESIKDKASPQAEYYYQIFNSDGLEASQCGNGARCLAKFIRDNKLSTANPIIVQTKNKLLTIDLLDDNKYQVNMGKANFLANSVPLNTNSLTFSNGNYKLENKELGTVEFGAVSIGNPHAIIIVEKINKIQIELANYFQDGSRAGIFPEGVNVNFAELVNRNFVNLRVIERGVGETLSCGSGACATYAYLRQQNKVDQEVTIKLPGGRLKLSQDKNKSILLTGDATLVFNGEVFI